MQQTNIQAKPLIFALAGEVVSKVSTAEDILFRDTEKHGDDFYRHEQTRSVIAKLRAAGQH